MDEADPALRRRAYPIDFNARFTNNPEEEDAENGVFAAVAEHDLKRKMREWLPYHMQLLIEWYEQYRAANYVLPAPPEGSRAVTALKENSARRTGAPRPRGTSRKGRNPRKEGGFPGGIRPAPLRHQGAERLRRREATWSA